MLAPTGMLCTIWALMSGDVRYRRRQIHYFALLIASAVILSAGGAAQGAQTMQRLNQQALEAFHGGRYGDAARSFDELESVFGREPEYLAPQTQRTIRPLHGYAHLLSGDAARAVSLFRGFLNSYEAPTPERRFVRYAMAQALEAAQEREAAIEAYGAFAGEFPGEPSAALAVLRQADLHLAGGELERAIELLGAIHTNAAHAPSLRVQARLSALQALSGSEAYDAAAELLFEGEWSLDTMPELGVLAFAALRIGDWMLARDRPRDALRAYGLVPPRDELIARQSERLEAVRSHYARYRERLAASDAALWEGYFQRITARIEATLEGLQRSEDYTPGFLLRKGQAFLLAERPREAIQVFREMATDRSLESGLRRDAHFRWIVAAQALERWDDALAICRDYLSLYPDSTRLPEMLFLMARTHRERGERDKAVEILEELLTGHPDHPKAGLWRYTRGFIALEQEDHGRARRHFADLLEIGEGAGGALLVQARYWHAMAWFFERAHGNALAELRSLRESLPERHPLAPEIRYREAATHYAMRDYGAALREIDTFLAAFPGHLREPESRVLRGDILMAEGRHIEAAADFRRVPPESLSLFVYALFQAGKIYRALEEYDLLVRHFQSYLERTDMAARPRISEALYWIGWARQQQGRADEAVPLFLAALDEYGDDPGAAEIDSILDALQRHFQMNPAIAAAMGGFDRFDSWLGHARHEALLNSRLTWYARITLRLAADQRRRGASGEADQLLREVADVVPERAMDAAALGLTGEFLYHAGEAAGAELYLASLLERFPGSADRAYAFHYLGRIAEDRGDWEMARRRFHGLLAALPMHSLAPEAALGHGRALSALGEYEAAQAQFEELLGLRQARGRPQAESLRELGRIAETLGERQRAIAYYQRVYNMYRAFPDLVADTYQRSAELFESIGDVEAAYRTWREITVLEHANEPRLRQRARLEMHRLRPMLPNNAMADAPPATGGEDGTG